MKRLALLGASGHGKVVADAALESGWQQVCFFDDAWPEKNIIGSWQVLGNTQLLKATLHEFDGVIVSIGDCTARWSKQRELQQAGSKFAIVVHPSAVVSRYAKLGRGSVVMAGVVINADAVVGEACIINTGATVDHDCLIEDAVHICPGTHLSGGVHIGVGAWVGIGASVKQGVNIGPEAMVGAGAVVVHSISAGQVVVGNPAREFKQLNT